MGSVANQGEAQSLIALRGVRPLIVGQEGAPVHVFDSELYALARPGTVNSQTWHRHKTWDLKYEELVVLMCPTP